MFTSNLAEEYRFYRKLTTLEPDIEDWLHRFPLVWAEAGGMGLGLHRAPIYVEIEAGAEPLKIHPYPMPLETKRGLTPYTETVKAGSPKTDSVCLEHTSTTSQKASCQ